VHVKPGAGPSFTSPRNEECRPMVVLHAFATHYHIHVYVNVKSVHTGYVIRSCVQHRRFRKHRLVLDSSVAKQHIFNDWV
jgi:hypothetical protein